MSSLGKSLSDSDTYKIFTIFNDKLYTCQDLNDNLYRALVIHYILNIYNKHSVYNTQGIGCGKISSTRCQNGKTIFLFNFKSMLECCF